MGTAIFIAAIGCFGLGIFLFTLYQAWTTSRERARWVRVPATIVESSTAADQLTMGHQLNQPGEMFDGAKATIHKPLVRYAYEFQGRPYESDEIGGASIQTGSRAVAEGIAAKYPVGAKVEAWVNPARPTEAALRPKVASWFVLTFVALSLAWTAGFGLLTWHFLK